METQTPLTFACRHCQHYAPEGRRGGQCERLGVPVQGGWISCSLAIPAFSSLWSLSTTGSDPQSAVFGVR